MALALVDYFDLRYDRQHRSPILFLKDVESEKYLPVWIGDLEARSIEDAYYQRALERPLTHDLFVDVLATVAVSLERVVIDKLEQGTYFATMFMDHAGKVREIDCRPSDAVAIALRMNARIYVEEDLMYRIKFVELREGEIDDEDDDGSAPLHEEDPASFQDFLRNISPADFRDG
jgi:hypothetical protein